MNVSNIAAGYKTHALVISTIVMIWAGFLGGGIDLGTAVQRTLEATMFSTIRMAVAKK